MKEIWKDVNGYEELYQVSNLGKIYSKRRKKILKNNIRNTYYIIQLTKNKERKSTNRYRLTIDKKEYKSFKTLEEAIKERDKILNEKI